MPIETKKKYLVPSLIATAFLMFAFGYAMVPLYDLLCRAIGINGKTDNSVAFYDPSSVSIDESRQINLRLVVVNNEDMPWHISSQVKKIDVHPGQVYQLTYKISNPTDKAMIAQAVPNVSPSNSAQYVKKLQCFCFDNLALDGHQEIEANVVFYIDPEIPDDLGSMTLSYTLFDLTA